MRRIISTDSYRLKFSAERVFNAVSDVSVYKDWWSRKVKIKVLNMTEELAGSRVEIRASGGWFRCEIVSVMRNSEVRVKYLREMALVDLLHIRTVPYDTVRP